MSTETRDALTVAEALDRYMAARAKEPSAGQEFRGPGDAQAFTEAQLALYALERAYESAART